MIAGQVLDQLTGLDDLLGVEAGGRLVEDEDVGIVDQRLRQADALLVALREPRAQFDRPCRRSGCAP